MVCFDKIKIEDFYSIGSIDYNFHNGIFKVEGYDKDTGTQNGAGKSTFSSAISQCLYNRSQKNPKNTLEGTYNTTTGRPYRIQLSLSIGEDKIEIDNDRTKNVINIKINGELQKVKGIKNQLTLIKDIVGVDYETFNALTYLSQSSISSVFDLTDTNNVLYKFFDIDTIKKLSTGLKNTRKDLSKRKHFLESQITEQQKIIQNLDRYQEIDVSQYGRNISELRDQIIELKDTRDTGKVSVLTHTKDKLTEELNHGKVKHAEMKTTYKVLSEQLEQLKTGICPVCDTVVDDKARNLADRVKEIREPLKALTDELKYKTQELDKVKDKLDSMTVIYHKNLKQLEDELTKNQNAIMVVEEKNRHFQSMKDDVKKIKESLRAMEEDVESMNNGLIFIASALEVINKGLLTKTYISNFISVFNNKIAYLLSLLDMNFDISVHESEGSLKYLIRKETTEVPYPSLSSGERTRVSLVVLLAILESLELMTNIQFNLVIFDELLSVLDSSGVEVFKTVLNKYRDQKNVLVILHHEEITSDYFDGYVYLTKEKGITKMEVKGV